MVLTHIQCLRLTLLFCLSAVNHTHAYTIGAILADESIHNDFDKDKSCIIEHYFKQQSLTDNGSHYIIERYDKTVLGSALAAQNLADKQVDLALLPLFSSEAEAASDVLAENGIEFITSATSEEVIKAGYRGLSTMPSNTYQINILFDNYKEDLKYKHVFVVYKENNMYSRTMASAFIKKIREEFPGKTNIEALSFYPVHPSDTSGHIDSNSLVFAPLYNPDIALLYLDLVKLNKKSIQIIGPDSVGGDKEFFDIVGVPSKQVELHFLKNWDGVPKGINASDLVAFHAHYCDGPLSFASTYVYDMLRMVESATVSEGRNSILNIKNSSYINTMDGKRYQFNHSHFNQKAMYLYQVSKSRIEKIKTIHEYRVEIND